MVGRVYSQTHLRGENRRLRSEKPEGFAARRMWFSGRKRGLGIGSRSAGYTIVEISLFLGVSALLFTIAIFATGNTIRNFRFSDSGRSLAAFVQKQYDDVLNGVNPRGDDVGCPGSSVAPRGASNCYLIGKLVLFKKDEYQITTYDIVGTEPAVIDFGASDEELIADYQPEVVTASGVGTYDVPWQAYISGIKRTSDNIESNALAIIRSPRSTRLVTYTYQETGDTPVSDLTSMVSNSNNIGKVTNYCLKNADGFGAPAKLVVGGATSNQSAAQIVFDADEGADCNA